MKAKIAKGGAVWIQESLFPENESDAPANRITTDEVYEMIWRAIHAGKDPLQLQFRHGYVMKDLRNHVPITEPDTGNHVEFAELMTRARLAFSITSVPGDARRVPNANAIAVYEAVLDALRNGDDPLQAQVLADCGRRFPVSACTIFSRFTQNRISLSEIVDVAQLDHADEIEAERTALWEETQEPLDEFM